MGLTQGILNQIEGKLKDIYRKVMEEEEIREHLNNVRKAFNDASTTLDN